MRHVILTVVILTTAAVCFAQHGTTYSSPGGFGNVIYPGTGHAPNAPATSIPRRFGGGGYGYPGVIPRVNHPSHGRNGVVPYPVIVGGYGFGGYGYGYDAPPPPQGYQDGGPQIVNNPAPSVVINQTFIPDRAVPMMREREPEPDPQQQSGMHVYEGLQTPQAVAARKRSIDQPTLYLLAFKDKRIVPALGYWIEGGNLHYVSTEHSLNQASLDLIDREMSQQLNDERNVEFRLPRE